MSTFEFITPIICLSFGLGFIAAIFLIKKGNKPDNKIDA